MINWMRHEEEDLLLENYNLNRDREQNMCIGE